MREDVHNADKNMVWPGEELYIPSSKGFSLVLTGAQALRIPKLSEVIMIGLQLPGSAFNSLRLQQ